MTESNTDLQSDVSALVNRFKTVLMATSTEDGVPEISYSPYVNVSGKLHVFLSDLALHTGNLKANPQASLFFIENEADAEKLHARKRVTFRARAELVDRSSDNFGLLAHNTLNQHRDKRRRRAAPPHFGESKTHAHSAVVEKGFADAHTLDCDGFPAV